MAIVRYDEGQWKIFAQHGNHSVAHPRRNNITRKKFLVKDYNSTGKIFLGQVCLPKEFTGKTVEITIKIVK